MSSVQRQLCVCLLMSCFIFIIIDLMCHMILIRWEVELNWLFITPPPIFVYHTITQNVFCHVQVLIRYRDFTFCFCFIRISRRCQIYGLDYVWFKLDSGVSYVKPFETILLSSCSQFSYQHLLVSYLLKLVFSVSWIKF